MRRSPRKLTRCAIVRTVQSANTVRIVFCTRASVSTSMLAVASSNTTTCRNKPTCCNGYQTTTNSHSRAHKVHVPTGPPKHSSLATPRTNARHQRQSNRMYPPYSDATVLVPYKSTGVDRDSSFRLPPSQMCLGRPHTQEGPPCATPHQCGQR